MSENKRMITEAELASWQPVVLRTILPDAFILVGYAAPPDPQGARLLAHANGTVIGAFRPKGVTGAWMIREIAAHDPGGLRLATNDEVWRRAQE